MKILISIGHPAHVHFFKNFIKIATNEGHEIKVIAKDKDNSHYLLNYYGFKHEIIGIGKIKLKHKLIGAIKTELNILKIARKFNPDILIGASGDFYVATIGWLINKTSIIFEDSEVDKSIYLLCEPFATMICTPAGFNKDLNPKKHIRYNGYKELAYLHPNYFTPDISIFQQLGLKQFEKYTLFRLVAWNAVHDLGQKGLTKENITRFINVSEKYGRVFISSEYELPYDLKKYQINISPERMHDALFFAHMFVGDSQTMTTEAALLGTPAIRSNSFVGTMSNFEELEKKYDLLYSFKDPDLAFKKMIELYKNDDLKNIWEIKRKKLLKDKIDVTKFMCDLINSFNIK
ncbi:MAG: DUF354 domain-containing protein [Candidatus Methanoperedenaceae archaeon]|nr:DUF354 domain-containing protein [Candidatus Methanoperedenaceae archaeon]